jgi:hypothetical protein
MHSLPSSGHPVRAKSVGTPVKPWIGKTFCVCVYLLMIYSIVRDMRRGYIRAKHGGVWIERSKNPIGFWVAAIIGIAFITTIVTLVLILG